ncbi:hypothetical protein AX774_g636, partial [Zancudomyces culisetae]
MRVGKRAKEEAIQDTEEPNPGIQVGRAGDGEGEVRDEGSQEKNEADTESPKSKKAKTISTT